MSPTVQGDNDQVLFNQVFIDAQVERDVENDQLSVTMVVEHEGNQPDDIARKVNKDMQLALNLAKTRKGIEVGTGSYQTYPVYKVRIIVGWRATQELQLRSVNISELTELVGELQKKLQVRQMSFSPTKETRVKIENDLINEAMEAFKDRINIIKTHMDNKDYPDCRFTYQYRASTTNYLSGKDDGYDNDPNSRCPGGGSGNKQGCHYYLRQCAVFLT